MQLHTLLPPETEYSDGDKGEALYASELALSLEKLNFTVRLHATKRGTNSRQQSRTGRLTRMHLIRGLVDWYTCGYRHGACTTKHWVSAA